MGNPTWGDIIFSFHISTPHLWDSMTRILNIRFVQDGDMERQPLIKFLIKMCDFRWDLDIKDGKVGFDSYKSMFLLLCKGILGEACIRFSLYWKELCQNWNLPLLYTYFILSIHQIVLWENEKLTCQSVLYQNDLFTIIYKRAYKKSTGCWKYKC